MSSPFSHRFGRAWLLLVLVAIALVIGVRAITQIDSLPSWNDGPAKQAILAFVRATTDQGGPHFIPPEERFATFDQDGTLWVEHLMYTQVIYRLARVPALVAGNPISPESSHSKPYLGQPRSNRAVVHARSEKILLQRSRHDGGRVQAEVKSGWPPHNTCAGSEVYGAGVPADAEP
jgi:hypothetical protein